MDALLQPLILIPCCAALAMLLIFACSSRVQDSVADTIRSLFGVQAQFLFIFHFTSRFGSLRSLVSQPFRFLIWFLRKTNLNQLLWFFYAAAVYICLLVLAFTLGLGILRLVGIKIGIGAEANVLNWFWVVPCGMFALTITMPAFHRIYQWSHALADYLVKVIYDYHNCLRSLKTEMEAQAQTIPQLDTARGRRSYSQAQVDALAEELNNPKPTKTPSPPPPIIRQ